MSNNLVDELIRVVAEVHDGTQPDGLWSHIRSDPDAFRRAVRHVLDRQNKATTTEDAWEKQWRPTGPHGWIQWKGTNVCMDVHCACGEMTHVDDDFVYHIKCSKCGRVYFCNGHIELIELEEEPENCAMSF